VVIRQNEEDVRLIFRGVHGCSERACQEGEE